MPVDSNGRVPWCVVQLGRYAEAEEALKRAIALSPGVWDVYKDYGMFLLNRGRFAEAVPIFEKV